MTVSTEISAESATAARELRVVVGRLRRRLRSLATADDLTPPQLSLLSHLDKDGDATASELATVEGIRGQSVAATVGALVADGLVERRADPDDGRRRILTITAAGRERLEGGRRTREEWLARAVEEHCSPEERRTLLAALELMDRVARA